MTESERSRLKRYLENLSEEEAEALMPPSLMEESEYDDRETLLRIKGEIDNRIGFRKERFLKIFSAVAAMLIVGLVGAVIYMSIESNHEDELMTIVSTSGSQKTVITLPDGSVVTLRGNSRMSFLKSFGKHDRMVDFSGQAYFQVEKDSGHPFIVDANGFSVTVLGTSFSLRSIQSDNNAEVLLDSGVISLMSEKTHKSMRMEPGDIAIIDKTTGEMAVSKKTDAISADWVGDELVYVNVSPDSLIQSLEESYQITLSPEIKQSIQSNFTGTLPWNDLATSLKILSKIYGFDLPF